MLIEKPEIKMEVECLALRDLTSPNKIKANLDEVGCRNNQKENIFVDRKRATSHNKDAMSTMLMNGKNAASPEQLHITPIKHGEQGAQPHPDPWTPTANLKMLISAASPDIRDREMKKVLFRPIENERKADGEDVKMDDQFDAAEEDEVVDEDEKKPSRKQKSLGLLCQKFLSLYPDYPASEPISISLDKVATFLGVERRRIYDIINVLESLMIVGRRVKNQYVWHGRWRLSSTLAELQAIGRQQHYHLLMGQAGEDASRDGAPPITLEDRGHGDSNYTVAGRRKDKSLRIMSQKFVMLFLVSKTQTVSLDMAAKILIEESQDTSNNSKYKTKVRRLYDIANVLTSLGLIRKVHVQDERGRKPAFRWIGPSDFQNSLAEDTEAVVSIAPPDANSAPSSPCRKLPGLLLQPVDYSRICVSNSAQFGTTTADAAPPGSVCRTPSHSDRIPLLCSEGLEPMTMHVCPEESSSQRAAPHQRAYLPSLAQASVVMLYGGPTAQVGLDPLTTEGQRSPGSRESVLGKRKWGEEDGKRATKEKREASGKTIQEEGSLEGTSFQGSTSQMTFTPGRAPGDVNLDRHSPPNNQGQASHYLYLSNSADLGALKFLLSGSQTPGSLTGTMPTLALPYILVSSSTLPPYPLAASGSDAHANLSFNLPSSSMISSARFVMGAAGPYVVAPEFAHLMAAAPIISSPEQHGMYGSGSATPHSPLEPRAPVTFLQTEPQTPQNLKETAGGSGSKSFFQTPGTMETGSYAPLARRRGSAQRRLDIGHTPSS
ncbi:hypothetical protein UPYG_G00350140 [Umbra pygmaea]|uniref:Transcription factor E2F7 n=1 Tax=Umbra pygmaea TaxID=75934 RepID=A0ABD0WCR3_UMBPY